MSNQKEGAGKPESKNPTDGQQEAARVAKQDAQERARQEVGPPGDFHVEIPKDRSQEVKEVVKDLNKDHATDPEKGFSQQDRRP